MGLISYELDLLSCRDDSRAETVFHHVAPKAFPGDVYLPPSSGPIPPYFWGATFSAEKAWASLPRHSGLAEARALVGDGGFETLEGVITEALEIITRMYETIDDEADAKTEALVPLRLSDDLQRWVAEQQARGRVLPAKGYGLQRANEGVIQSLGAVRWPDPLLTNNTLFGPGFANLLIGAHDARSLYSNYCCDTGFYYEHGFHKVFSQFEPLLRQARDDAHSLQTPGGVERRRAADLCLRYVLGKVALEERHVARLSGKSARFGRRAAQVVCFAESSLLGMAAEAMARGFDPAAVWADMVFSSPATDVVDVGSDLGNSEVLNSLLNTADLAGPAAGGVVTEPALRRVYDAYACVCARLFTHRWEEPTARMCGQLYVWHLKDDRHLLLRRALLGWPKARRSAKPPPQREADFDEVFDEHYYTTGFSRPLTTACDGDEPCCNQVMQFVQQRADEPLLPRLWDDLVTRPLAYVAGGAVDARRERALCDALGDTQARMYAKGLVAEMAWMTCHASQHAWQINYLMEAAMFGSLLDDGALRGKLDRADG